MPPIASGWVTAMYLSDVAAAIARPATAQGVLPRPAFRPYPLRVCCGVPVSFTLAVLLDVLPHPVYDIGTQRRFTDIAEHANRYLTRVLLASLHPQQDLGVLAASDRDADDIERRVFRSHGFLGDPCDIRHGKGKRHDSTCRNERTAERVPS